MTKRRPLKPSSQWRAEREEKVLIGFAQMKEQGLSTEDAVHKLRVKYRLGRSTIYRYIQKAASVNAEG